MYSLWCMRLSRRFSLRFSSLWCGSCLFKKTTFSLYTDQITVTVAFILKIAIEQTFVLKRQRKCRYRNLSYMLAPLPSPHSTSSSSLFKLPPLPNRRLFRVSVCVRSPAHSHTSLLVSEDIFFSGGACGAQTSTDGAVFQATSVGG